MRYFHFYRVSPKPKSGRLWNLGISDQARAGKLGRAPKFIPHVPTCPRLGDEALPIKISQNHQVL